MVAQTTLTRLVKVRALIPLPEVKKSLRYKAFLFYVYPGYHRFGLIEALF